MEPSAPRLLVGGLLDFVLYDLCLWHWDHVTHTKLSNTSLSTFTPTMNVSMMYPWLHIIVFGYGRATKAILGVEWYYDEVQVWSAKRQVIEIPLDLPGLQMAIRDICHFVEFWCMWQISGLQIAAGRVNFPNNCYSLDITASEDVRRENMFLLDAIASPSTFPCQSVGQWVSQWVIDSFRWEIAIASPSFASLFLALQELQNLSKDNV